jgi:haloalkane dehalogenase
MPEPTLAQTGFEPDPELYPFESRFFQSSVGRIHYVDEGSGPPLLLLHGNPTWSFLYRKIITALRGDFRCVACDYPGFGLSERPPGYGYTPREHAVVVGELVDELELRDFILMGQDWGGPIGTAVGSARPDRVRGVVLGNTWFWPADTATAKVFSRVMSSALMQRAILKRNFFVERLIPAGVSHTLSEREMDHYRRVQPTPEARAGVAEFPRQILAAEGFLSELSTSVPRTLGSKPALLVWGMKDFAFPFKRTVPRIQAAFSDWKLVELPEAKHFIQEDAPSEIAAAIRERFG